MAADPLLSIAEELYGLTPGEFTGTRNAWAKQTKADGDPELAKRVGELRKPSLPAWVVNMMMRHQGEEMAQVLDLGASLRQAQADLDGEALRELTRQRRQLTTAVTHQGRMLAGQLGQKVTEAVADQVQATLHAAMVDEDAAAAVRSGMLVGPLVATGVGSADVVDAVAVPAAIGMTARPRARTAPAASAPVPERPGLSVVPPPEPTPDEQQRAREAEQEARRRSAQEAVAAALADADEAQRRLRKADKRVKRVQAHTLQTADELDQARRRVAELEHELEGLDDEAGSAEERRVRAEQRYAEAQRALEQAQAALSELSELDGA
ncbi:MAG TPA: hypothetical protein VER39_00900 [Nocardioidaceae bacterium]|nr:hypothetical protein [Nocardioidaceae bacterium]